MAGGTPGAARDLHNPVCTAAKAEATAVASVAAGTEAVGRLEAVLATVEAKAVGAAPGASPLADEGDTVGEERAVMAGAVGVVGCAVEATVGAMGAPTGEAGAKVVVVLTAALTVGAIDDG